MLQSSLLESRWTGIAVVGFVGRLQTHCGHGQRWLGCVITARPPFASLADIAELHGIAVAADGLLPQGLKFVGGQVWVVT